MKVYLVSTLVVDGDGYKQEIPETLFYNGLSAQVFCLNLFIKRESERCGLPDTPNIYKLELSSARNDPENFVNTKILNEKENNRSEHFDEFSNDYEFSIREMEVK